jgi:hypothetical protein
MIQTLHLPLTLLEILVIISATLQIGIIVFSLFFRKILSKDERKIWGWFAASLILILGRRFLATLRYACEYPTLELEYTITIITTICWIIFIYKLMAKKMCAKEKKKIEEKNNAIEKFFDK